MTLIAFPKTYARISVLPESKLVPMPHMTYTHKLKTVNLKFPLVNSAS